MGEMGKNKRRELRQTSRRRNCRQRCERVAGGAEAIAGEIAEQQTEDTAEQNGKESSCVESPPLLLLVIHIPIPRPANEREQDSGGVRTRNMQVEHEDSEQDSQHLFDICYAKTLASVSRKHGGRGGVKHTGHSHAQRSRLLVRRETDNV